MPVAASALTGAFAILPRATQAPWRGPERLRYPACRAIARAAPSRRVRRLYAAWLAGIDEGLDHGCAASSAAPSAHGAPGQLGEIDAPRCAARLRARAALRRLARRTLPPRTLTTRFGLPVAHVRTSVAQNGDIESPSLTIAHGIPVDSPPELCHIPRRSKVHVNNLCCQTQILLVAENSRTLRSPGQTPHSPLV